MAYDDLDIDTICGHVHVGSSVISKFHEACGDFVTLSADPSPIRDFHGYENFCFLGRTTFNIYYDHFRVRREILIKFLRKEGYDVSLSSLENVLVHKSVQVTTTALRRALLRANISTLRIRIFGIKANAIHLQRIRAALAEYVQRNPTHATNLFDVGRMLPLRRRRTAITLRQFPSTETPCDMFPMFINEVNHAGGIRFRYDLDEERHVGLRDELDNPRFATYKAYSPFIHCVKKNTKMKTAIPRTKAGSRKKFGFLQSLYFRLQQSKLKAADGFRLEGTFLGSTLEQVLQTINDEELLEERFIPQADIQEGEYEQELIEGDRNYVYYDKEKCLELMHTCISLAVYMKLNYGDNNKRLTKAEVYRWIAVLNSVGYAAATTNNKWPRDWPRRIKNRLQPVGQQQHYIHIIKECYDQGMNYRQMKAALDTHQRQSQEIEIVQDNEQQDEERVAEGSESTTQERVDADGVNVYDPVQRADLEYILRWIVKRAPLARANDNSSAQCHLVEKNGRLAARIPAFNHPLDLAIYVYLEYNRDRDGWRSRFMANTREDNVEGMLPRTQVIRKTKINTAYLVN